jgi:DNA transformation protein
MSKSEFVDYLLELIAPLGNVSARAMFGGHGIYVDSQIIGIVIGDILYFKTDEDNRQGYLDEGLEPFSFTARSKTVATGYFRAPDEAMDSPHAMLPWARGALAAALRSAAAKARVPQRTPKAKVNPGGKKSRKR